MIALIARRAFTHRGRAYRAGERFRIAPLDAAALTYQHKADFADDADEKVESKGKYRRRDLRAEK
jgi:hypothetical protein